MKALGGKPWPPVTRNAVSFLISLSLGVGEALKFGTFQISFYPYSEPTFVFTQKSTCERAVTCRVICSPKIMEKSMSRQVLRDPVVFVGYQSQRYSLE